MKHEDHERAYGPGIVVERRQLLRWTGAATALSLSSSLPHARPVRERDASVFEEFAASWRELTDFYLEGDDPGEDAYLHMLAGSIAGLPLGEIPEMQNRVFGNERITTGPAFVDAEIFIVVLRMQPGAVVSPHNHPEHIVATTCLEGSCHFRHFETLAPPATDDHTTGFQVRETRKGIMIPGDTTHLSRRRDNVHTFESGAAGAVLVDFTIERTQGSSFGMLEIEEETEDRFHGIHAARWTEVKF